MSITLKDCLSLPSMSFGRVIAGSAGLDKIVSSISVLEFFEHESYGLDVFTPNELILSAFYDFSTSRLSVFAFFCFLFLRYNS